MADKVRKVPTKKFTALSIGATFYADGVNGYTFYRKVSGLEYESVADALVLGTSYATPNMVVDLESKFSAAPPKPVAKKAAPKKQIAKKAAKK